MEGESSSFSRCSRLRRGRGGFTLIELMVVIGVISIALLGLIASMIFGMKANESASRRTIALNHARTIMGEIRDSDKSYVWPTRHAALMNNPTDRIALNAAPLSDPVLADNPEQMTRNVLISLLTGDAYRVNNLRKVQVRVYFTVKGIEKSVELIGFVPRIKT